MYNLVFGSSGTSAVVVLCESIGCERIESCVKLLLAGMHAHVCVCICCYISSISAHIAVCMSNYNSKLPTSCENSGAVVVIDPQPTNLDYNQP